ncbi:MAG: amidohydrolase family protein [Saprospiraceae bacterium]|nr:amidohydrolase family protein [Saprospiraceae bacterium]
MNSTGGVLSAAKDGKATQFSIEEIKELVEAVDDYGLVTVVNAHGPLGTKRAGGIEIQSIEHGTFMNLDTIELMKQRGTYMVPTISEGKFVFEKAMKDVIYVKTSRTLRNR